MSWFRKIWEEMNRPLSECAACNGTGKRRIGHLDIDCTFCKGTGKNSYFRTNPQQQRSAGPKKIFGMNVGNIDNTCPDCEGDGWVITKAPRNRFTQKENRQTCGKCNGRGYL